MDKKNNIKWSEIITPVLSIFFIYSILVMVPIVLLVVWAELKNPEIWEFSIVSILYLSLTAFVFDKLIKHTEDQV